MPSDCSGRRRHLEAGHQVWIQGRRALRGHVQRRETRDPRVGEVAYLARFDERPADRERRRLVDDRLVLGAVELLQPFRQHLQAGPPDLAGRLRAPDDAHLPQDQRDRDVGSPPSNEEVRGVVALTPGRPRVELEIDVEAILGGDAREDPGREPLGARAGHRVVRRPVEHAGMTVEDHADVEAFADVIQDRGRDVVVDLGERSAGAVQMFQRLGRGIQLLEPPDRRDLGEQVEHLVGALDPGDRLARGVEAGSDPRTDDRERAGACYGIRNHPASAS